MTEEPSPVDLWRQAGGGTPSFDRGRYRALMLEHGHLVPLKPGEKSEPLPCGWSPNHRDGRHDAPCASNSPTETPEQPPRRPQPKLNPRTIGPAMTATTDLAERFARTRAFEDLPHTCRCGTRWAGANTCHCGKCHLTFGGEGAFRQHRRGGDCNPPATVGLTLIPGRAYEAWGAPSGEGGS